MKHQLLFIFIISCCGLPMQLHAAEAKVVAAAAQAKIVPAIKQKATPLELEMIKAAHTNNFNKVDELLKGGARIDAQDSRDRTALMWAARRGHTHIVNALIKKGANLTIQDTFGKTALMMAIAYNRIDSVNALITAKADLNVQNIIGVTALMIASEMDTITIVNALIAAGADLNIQDTFGGTALMFAALNGRINSANALITAKADLNTRDADGQTALMFAAWKGYKNIILSLLNVNADPYLVSYDAQTIRERLLQQDETETIIAKYITKYARKNFSTILQTEHPDLWQDPEIQQALKNYADRLAAYKKQQEDVAKHVEADIEEVHFPPVLANIVAGYTVEHAPAVFSEALF